jgi:hypothetical protein
VVSAQTVEVVGNGSSQHPLDIVVDGERVYWSDFESFPLAGCA